MPLAGHYGVGMRCWDGRLAGLDVSGWTKRADHLAVSQTRWTIGKGSDGLRQPKPERRSVS
jgi:hypothetical protein